MKLTSTLKSAALALGVFTTLGFTAACGSDAAALSVEPGDYEGVGVFVIDDFEDDDRGYLYLSITVNEDGTVEGTGEVYQPIYYVPGSVPDGDDSLTVSGEVTAEGFSIVVDEDITGTGEVAADGTMTASFSGTTEEGEIEGFLGLVPAWGTETAIACGAFGVNGSMSNAQGFVAYLAGAEGDLFGVHLGVTGDDFTGISEGTFDAGAACAVDTCNGQVEASLDGELDGESISVDITDADVYFEVAEGENDSWVAIYDGDFTATDFNGGFTVDTEYCLDGSYDN